MNSKCPMDSVFEEKFRIGLARDKPMVVIWCGQSNFRERETLGLPQYYFANELVGFASCKKNKVICEGVSVSQFILSPVIKYALTICC